MFVKKENELDFACQSCGNCCKNFNINLTHLDIERILLNRPDLNTDYFVGFSASDKDDNESFISTYGKRQIILKKKKNLNECVFLQNNICSIHEFKPRVCKVWPFSLEPGNKISWIKEHRSFIKKSCKHTSIPGANDPDEILTLLKQHYKERKIYSKLTNKWNESKKMLINSEEMFIDIYDDDFLNFILEEMNIRTETESEIIEEESELTKIINTLIKDQRICAITQSSIDDIYTNDRNCDYSFNVYIQDNALISFSNKTNLDSLNTGLGSDLYIYDEANNKISFSINNNFLDLKIKTFLDLKKDLNHDTKIIYNSYNIDLNLKTLYDQTKEELLKVYDIFWFKILKVIKYIEKDNLLDAKFLFNSIVNIEFSSLIFWLNQSKFTLSDINTLEYKNKELKDLFISFDSNNSINELKISLTKVVEIFYSMWKITGLANNSLLESKIKEKLENIT